MAKTSQVLTDEEVKRLLKESQEGSTRARDELVEANTKLVWSVVQRYMKRGYDAEDLFQIGCIGLMKSIDKFDLSYNVKFSTYAVPMIIGEIQRFIRDDGTVKVSRGLKELNHKIKKKREEWMKEYGRSPTMKELEEELDISSEELVQAEEAGRMPKSIYETVYEHDGDALTLADQMTEEEEDWFHHIAIEDVMSQLKKREKVIIYLRYYQDYTQTEVAKRLGISQVQVSRLEKNILKSMKEMMKERT
ncbi:RNA polymerase sporulation sigma factor SigF [Salimicrobium halophilum]|uniref:RNA polymerase sigma factor n=1 Tax=Salimicrobium halophilum TaxID=86666 RepID=A0A1G8PXP5_9BACI|nr:RNA polymerase sporulation sigma factor SigF [Salimicrobium halophilum]SDI97138.1 RNA polymerase, sigma subunit, RpoX/SigF [Salimicrobium halophilum]